MKRVPFRQRSIDRNSIKRVELTNKSQNSYQMTSSHVSSFSKQEKTVEEQESSTLRKNQQYIEKIDEELRNFGCNDQSSFFMDSNLEDEVEVKHL